MQETLASTFICITVFTSVSLFVVGETRGNNVTFMGRPSHFSNVNSWYEGERAFLRDRFSPGDAILSPPDGKGPYCRHPAKCEHLNYTACMGVKLPYASTTLDLVGDSSTQDHIQERLQQWQGLRHIPKCWAVVQQFLCALYMPKCENGTVDLPSQEMCKMTMGPCRLLYSALQMPSFFKCDDTTRFPTMCKNDVRELKFNTTGQCQSPLVPTDNTLAFYEGVEGCGVQCQNPLLTEDEHRQIHQLVALAGTICLLFNLFAVVTFCIDWRSSRNKYPALAVFYINCCLLVSCIGWLAQFIPGAREGIVCRKDGTLRMSEPSAGENLSCVIVFVLVYYFIMAALVWCVIFTYTWHTMTKAVGKIQNQTDKKSSYFHMVAWSLPLVLTITTMALGEIDGDSVAGICFVGYANQAARAGFLLGPITTVLLIGGYFLTRGIVTLVRYKIDGEEYITESTNKAKIAKIRQTIVRMGLFSLLMFVFEMATFVCHAYEFHHHDEWKESFRRFIICQVVSTGNADPSQCRMDSRPSLSMLQLHLLVMFLAGVFMSSWVWTNSTINIWRRCLKRILNSQAEKPVRVKRHKVIAQAYAKRKTFNNAGRLSISFYSSHEDPVGLNFDVSSAASQDLNYEWAAGLPKLVTRRGALIVPATGSNSSQQRNSNDSEISYSMRRVSVESRRHSLDSQVSVQIAEVTATRKAAFTPMPTAATATVSGGRGKKARSRRQRREFGRNRVGPLFARRGSTSSQESQLRAHILSALTLANINISSFVPNNLKKRRAGITGLYSSKVNLPFALPGQSSDLSDEERNSDEKTPGPAKKFDVILCGEANEVELEDGNRSEEEVSDGTVAEDEKKVGMLNDLDLDGRNSKRDDSSTKRKSRSIEMDDRVKICHDKAVSMIDWSRSSELFNHRSKSADNDGHRNRTTEKNRNKIGCRDFRNRNISDEVNLYSTEESDDESPQKLNFMPSVDVAGVSDGSTSFCPELSRLALLSSHSGISAGSPHSCGTGKVHMITVAPCKLSNSDDKSVNAREVGTQTSLSIDCIEMQEENTLYSTPPPRACTSQSTQVSPSRSSVPPKKSQRRVEKSQSPHINKMTGNVSSTPTARGLDYSYNVHRLVQELAENNRVGSPLRPERRKRSKSKNNARSKSADDQGIELQCKPVVL